MKSSYPSHASEEGDGAGLETIDIRDAIPGYTDSAYGASLRAAADQAYAQSLTRDSLEDLGRETPTDEELESLFDFTAASSAPVPIHAASSGIDIAMADCASHAADTAQNAREPERATAGPSLTTPVGPTRCFSHEHSGAQHNLWFPSEVQSAEASASIADNLVGPSTQYGIPSQPMFLAQDNEQERAMQAFSSNLGIEDGHSADNIPVDVQRHIGQQLRSTATSRQSPTSASTMSRAAGISKKPSTKKARLPSTWSKSVGGAASTRSVDWEKDDDIVLYHVVQGWEMTVPTLSKADRSTKHKWAFVSKAFDNKPNKRSPVSCMERMQKVNLGGRIVHGVQNPSTSWTQADDLLHRDIRRAGYNDKEVAEAMGGKFAESNVRRRWAVVSSASNLWPDEWESFVNGGA